MNRFVGPCIAFRAWCPVSYFSNTRTCVIDIINTVVLADKAGHFLQKGVNNSDIFSITFFFIEISQVLQI